MVYDFFDALLYNDVLDAIFPRCFVGLKFLYCCVYVISGEGSLSFNGLEYAVSGIVHLLGGGGKNVSASTLALAMFSEARKSCWNSLQVLRDGMCVLE